MLKVGIAVERVAQDRMAGGARESVFGAGTNQRNHFMALLSQNRNQAAADVAGATGNKNALTQICLREKCQD